MYKIKLKTNFKNILQYKSFILVAFNLSLYYHLKSKKIDINNNFIFWPDGVFVKFFFPKIEKIPGRDLIKKFQNKNKIKKLFVIGNLDQKGFYYLKRNFVSSTITQKKLPIKQINSLKSIIDKKYDDKTLLLITLPSPKQEQIASYLNKINTNIKIICLGGGLEMASNDKKKPTRFIENYFEFFWRLKSDFIRRFVRLIKSTLYIFYLIIDKDLTIKLNSLCK